MVEPQARGQTVSQGTFWGGVEVSPGPSRSLSGGDYEKWLGKASSCLVSLNCMFGGRRFDLNLLRCRFCCQGISGGGKSARLTLFKVSRVRAEQVLRTEHGVVVRLGGGER